MSASRVLVGLALAGLVLLAVTVWRTGSGASGEGATPAMEAPSPAGAAPEEKEPARSFVVEGQDPLEGRVGQGLNVADGTGKRDLQILGLVLNTWRTNAPGIGNPVGNNSEITAALTGHNPWQVAIIPPDHPAINARGELCDRWGTPLFFHQLSGERMEIWSNGPDGRRGTEDDVVLTP